MGFGVVCLAMGRGLPAAPVALPDCHGSGKAGVSIGQALGGIRILAKVGCVHATAVAARHCHVCVVVGYWCRTTVAVRKGKHETQVYTRIDFVAGEKTLQIAPWQVAMLVLL